METVSDGSGGTTYRLHAGLAALKGVDAAGNPCVKIVRVEEEPWTSDTVYLSLKCEQKSRTYADGNNKVIANEYKAAPSATPSDDALKISATDGAPRLVDTLGITQKLNTVGGNARDVKVTFVESMEDARPELKSGSSLGLLLQQIRKWFDELKDLKALAFKEKVTRGDLTEELAGELAGKALLEHSHEVATASSKGFMSSDDKKKLDGIKPNANNYSLPLAASGTRGGVQIGYTQSGRNYPVQLSNEKMYVNVPWTDTKYSHPGYTSRSSGLYKITVDSQGHVSEVTAVTKSDITALGIPGQDTTYSVVTTSSNGLMSSSDKSKLNGIATGANNNYTHPTSAGNKHIPSGGSSGQFLKYSSSGTATWANLPQMTNGGNVSSSFTLYPGIIRKPTANITCYVGKSDEETLKYKNVSYINNTGWCQIKVVDNSGVVVVFSEAAKNRNGNTNNAGLWMFTWASIDIVHVHFFEEAERLA